LLCLVVWLQLLLTTDGRSNPYCTLQCVVLQKYRFIFFCR